jgi:hypothetical protein
MWSGEFAFKVCQIFRLPLTYWRGIDRRVMDACSARECGTVECAFIQPMSSMTTVLCTQVINSRLSADKDVFNLF